MGILDDIEKIDETDGLKAQLKRIEKMEEENNRMLKEILKLLRTRARASGKKEGEKR